MPMDGVANTSGTRTHKEIRLSLDYVLKTRDRAADEITGVLVHEVVHCFQYDARGTCPGGLIEGVAGVLCVLACARSTLIADLTPMSMQTSCAFARASRRHIGHSARVEAGMRGTRRQRTSYAGLTIHGAPAPCAR